MARFWIIAVIATAGVMFFLSGCGRQGAGGTSPDSEPTHRTPPVYDSWDQPKKLP
jgi:hypothetical protein